MSDVAADAGARTIGKYRLYGRIGAGGMGSVYLARLFAPGGFRRIVAVKRLHSQYAEDAAFVSAFLDEARLASRIHHPNVVAPLDVIAEDGEVSLVFEHVLGVSLSTLVRRANEQHEPVPLRVTTSLMVNVLHGLQAAHEARGDDGEALGLVHRDVSPQNVLIGRDGSARLLDFGIAKATGRSQTTDEGVVKGKRGYMAPEHMVNATSQSSDVYSAAVMLWEIVANQRLFPDDSSIGQRLTGYLAPPPSTHARAPVSAEGATMLAALDAITMRGLAHDVSARYASALEMAIALESIGVASSREVGEFVERVAREDLDERKKLVELAEATNGIVPSPPFSSTASNTLALGPAPTSDVATADAVFSEVSSPPPRRLPLAIVSLLLVMSFGLALAFAKYRYTATDATAAAREEPSSAAVVREDPAPPAIPDGSAPTSALTPAAQASAAPTASASARPHGLAGRPPNKRSGATCKPYVIDKDGHTQFNEACLR